jgi:Zn-dependent M16 (insulinase) family peptidase
MQAEVFEKLKQEAEGYWLDVIKKWIYKTNSITIIAKPSEDMMHKIGEEDKQRVAERKQRLGKKGLAHLEHKLENAIDQNDVSMCLCMYVGNRLERSGLKKY